MKTLIIAVITFTAGGTLEVVAPSLEQCESWTLAAKTAQSFTVTDENDIVETVASVECRAQDVNTPDPAPPCTACLYAAPRPSS